MRDIFALEATTTINTGGSYVYSYPYLVDYFSSIKTIGPGDVVRGAHMVFGWMPTILKLKPKHDCDLSSVALLLTKARTKRALEWEEIQKVASLINNSVVGASKLLHFIVPSSFPIWDSKVYSFVHEKRAYNYSVNDVGKYIQYIALLTELRGRDEFPSFFASVQKKLNYSVSPLRALELVMFLNAPIFDSKSSKKSR